MLVGIWIMMDLGTDALLLCCLGSRLSLGERCGLAMKEPGMHQLPLHRYKWHCVCTDINRPCVCYEGGVHNPARPRAGNQLNSHTSSCSCWCTLPDAIGASQTLLINSS